jgi:monovalent cation/proton antiporter MnhG/PhaG subunit
MNLTDMFSALSAREAAVIITGSLGLLFMLISLIGIIRLPDFFTRLHAQGVGDTLGALLLIISMMTAAGAGLMSVKLFLVIAHEGIFTLEYGDYSFFTVAVMLPAVSIPISYFTPLESTRIKFSFFF